MGIMKIYFYVKIYVKSLVVMEVDKYSVKMKNKIKVILKLLQKFKVVLNLYNLLIM